MVQEVKAYKNSRGRVFSSRKEAETSEVRIKLSRVVGFGYDNYRFIEQVLANIDKVCHVLDEYQSQVDPEGYRRRKAGDGSW